MRTWLLFMCVCLFTSTVVGDGRRCEWLDSETVNAVMKSNIETTVWTTLRQLGKDTRPVDKIESRLTKKEERPTGDQVVRVRLFVGEVVLLVSCTTSTVCKVEYVWDQALEYRNEPITDRPVHSKEGDAQQKSIEVVKLLTGVDVNQTNQWSVRLHGFIRRDWSFQWRPIICGYPAPGVIAVDLADNNTLEMVRFQMSLPIITNKFGPNKVDGKEACSLGDKYLKRYYRKNELGTLDLKTNCLEIMQPNHLFTPQFSEEYYSSRGLTNEPVLLWRVQYKRKPSSMVTTPVEIWVDAENGAMLGGFE